MADLLNSLESLKPDFKSAVYGAIGLLGTLIWTAIRERRIGVAWTAVFQAIKPVGTAPVSSKVSVLVNEQPALNLHCCQITVVNESSRDIENIDLLFTFHAPFSIVEGTGGLVGSGKALLFSDGFKKTIEGVKAMSEDEKKTAPSFEYLLRAREFNLPALNRGETASFMFWINSPSANDNPVVLTTTEKVGVKMISRRANIHPLNVAQLKVVLLLGVPITFLYFYFIESLGLSPLPSASLMVLGVFLCGVFGLLLESLLRWIRRVV